MSYCEKEFRLPILRAACLLLIGLIWACSSAGPARSMEPVRELHPLPGTAFLANTSSDDFTFIVGGDNRLKKGTIKPGEIVKKIFREAKHSNAKFILWSGDTIYGKNPDDHELIKTEYREFLKLAHRTGKPIFNAPGNHEMADADGLPNEVMKSWYTEIMGLPYGAFSYGNARFIALNSEEIPPPGLRETPKPGKRGKEPGYVSPEQIQWLKSELDANKEKTHIFIFMHHPIKSRRPTARLAPSCAEQLLELFSHYQNISYVLSGHEHLYFNPQNPEDQTTPPSRKGAGEPTIYLVSGGAGAPLDLENGGFYHYLIFHVNKAAVDVKLVRVQ